MTQRTWLTHAFRINGRQYSFYGNYDGCLEWARLAFVHVRTCPNHSLESQEDWRVVAIESLKRWERHQHIKTTQGE